jgi:hypothetical protein
MLSFRIETGVQHSEEMPLFGLFLILCEKWYKLRANIHQTIVVQFNGLTE